MVVMKMGWPVSLLKGIGSHICRGTSCFAKRTNTVYIFAKSINTVYVAHIFAFRKRGLNKESVHHLHAQTFLFG